MGPFQRVQPRQRVPQGQLLRVAAEEPGNEGIGDVVHHLLIEAPAEEPGDAVEVVAATARIRRELGWQPRYDDLERIVRDALAFERRLGGPQGK